MACFSRPVLNPQKLEKHGESKVISHKKSDMRYDPILDAMIHDEISSKSDAKSTLEIPKEVRRDSVKRAKDAVFEIVFANEFKYFITLTLDRTKISRTDTFEIRSKLNRWLSNQVQRNQMRYVILPEYHKKTEDDGQHAIHFHGLVSGVFQMKDSGLFTKRAQPILNMENWHYGHTTTIALDDNYERTANYIMKYITKDNQKILGRWYLSGGKGLIRKVPTEYFNIDYDTFEGTEYMVPAANMAVKYKTILEHT